MEKITVVKRCAWCGAVLGTEVWEKTKYNFEGVESHVICQACMQKEIAVAVECKAKTMDSAIKSRNDMYII